MKREGWAPHQYSVWEHDPVDHYLIGNVNNSVDGFVPATHQMNFWNDIVPEGKEKDFIVIGGTAGGEFFSYQAFGVRPYKNFSYCKNHLINQWLNYFPEEWEVINDYLIKFKSAILPFLSYEYLKYASRVPEDQIFKINNELDSVRQAIICDSADDLMDIAYGHHSYHWTLSQETLDRIKDYYYNSKFYQDHKFELGNLDEDIFGMSGCLFTFAISYSKIYE